MATETREVQVCDQCGTQRDVAVWPQLWGMDLCEDCADKVREAGWCSVCDVLGTEAKLHLGPDGRKYCRWCIETGSIDG